MVMFLFVGVIMVGKLIWFFNYGRMCCDFIYIDDVMCVVFRLIDFVFVDDLVVVNVLFKFYNVGNYCLEELMYVVGFLECELGWMVIKELLLM